MYSKIDIDFDVYKEITIRRHSPEVTENDVLRELLGLEIKNSQTIQTTITNAEGIAWTSKGVSLPAETILRATFNGREYFAKIENGTIVYDGQKFKSPSPAAEVITGYPINGWTFWECKLPGKSTWKTMKKLRGI